MSQLIVPRALKKLPPFEIIPVMGGNDNAVVHTWSINSARPSNIHICPYTDFIPFSYLAEGYDQAFGNTLRYLCERQDIVGTRVRLNRYLFYNQLKNVEVYWASRMNYDRLLSSFMGTRRQDRFDGGDYYYNVDKYGVYLERDANLIPAILLVIPKENWLACKMELMKTGRVSLSRCVLLIDQALDTTGYFCQSYRNGIHKKVLLPYIEGLSVTVAKVPLSYMMEKCFLKDFQFSSTNIFDRKKEEEHIKKQFISSVGKHLLSGTVPNTIPLEEMVFGEGITTTTINYSPGEGYTWSIPADRQGDIPHIVGGEGFTLTSGVSGPGGEIRWEPRSDSEVAFSHAMLAQRVSELRAGEGIQRPYTMEDIVDAEDGLVAQAAE